MKINLSGLVLLTGVPGSGKTLRMMEYLYAALAEGRPCYVCNVDGLNVPGAIPFDDPHQWQDLPARSVLFVDEAQRYFRARRGMIDPPQSITAMETIRHDGVCIVMTTQQPTYLDKHIRGLIGHHEHIVEVIAGRTSNVYTFRSTRDEVTPSALNDATYELWQHPRKLHGAYTSAEVHTKKTLIPLRVKALAALALAVVAYGAYAFWPKSDQPTSTQKAQAAPAAGPSPATGRPVDGPRPMTRMEYAERYLPRFASIPKSAPAYDDRPVVAEPQIFCMSSMPGQAADGHREASVTCLTEQGTRYDIADGEARYLARHGARYDPHKVPSGLGGVGGVPPSPMGAPAPVLASPGPVISAAQVSGYGDHAIPANPGSAP